MSTRKSSRLSPRERLLSTATALFTDHGIRTVGIDRILRESGVAKASLYSIFGSKDELIVAYLHELDMRDRQRWYAATEHLTDPKKKILTFFELAAADIAPGLPGCYYLRAAIEFPTPETEGEKLVRSAVDERREWFYSTVVTQLYAMGLEDSNNIEEMASRMTIIYDGGITGAKLGSGQAAVHTARRMADVLLGLVAD